MQKVWGTCLCNTPLGDSSPLSIRSIAFCWWNASISFQTVSASLSHQPWPNQILPPINKPLSKSSDRYFRDTPNQLLTFTPTPCKNLLLQTHQVWAAGPHSMMVSSASATTFFSASTKFELRRGSEGKRKGKPNHQA